MTRGCISCALALSLAQQLAWVVGGSRWRRPLSLRVLDDFGKVVPIVGPSRRSLPSPPSLCFRRPFSLEGDNRRALLTLERRDRSEVLRGFALARGVRVKVPFVGVESPTSPSAEVPGLWPFHGCPRDIACPKRRLDTCADTHLLGHACRPSWASRSDILRGSLHSRCRCRRFPSTCPGRSPSSCRGRTWSDPACAVPCEPGFLLEGQGFKCGATGLWEGDRDIVELIP